MVMQTQNRPMPGRSLMAPPERAREIREASLGWPSLTLTARQIGLVELLLTGGLAPLAGFMTRAEAQRVEGGGSLPDGTPWPCAVVLDVPDALAARLQPVASVALRDHEGVMLAAVRVTDAWRDERWHVGGSLEGIQLPVHHDFVRHRLSPAAAASEFETRGWARVVSFQPGLLLHAGHREALARAAGHLDAGVLVQMPLTSVESPTVEQSSRVLAFEHAIDAWRAPGAALAILPDAGLAGGAALQFVVARNYGCSHTAFEPGAMTREAWERVEALASALGIGVVQLPDMRYDVRRAAWVEYPAEGRGASEGDLRRVTEEEVLRRVRGDLDVPDWMAGHAEVGALRRAFPPRDRQGFTVFFTGLSGSGKSTIASALRATLTERTGRPVTFLDGDLVRRHLSSELGFSREHRDLNILRIGWVASEITRHGGIAICAPIAPYDAIRKEVRSMIEPVGGFVLVHVSTPLAVCEQRDRKGLYAKARAGLIPQFTGISDPYEEPADATLTLDTTNTSADDAVAAVVAYLERQGYVR